MILLPPIKNSVYESIELIERTFMQHSEESSWKSFDQVQDWSFNKAAKITFRKQARMVRLTAVERALPLVWLTRTHTALNTLTNFLCHDAKVKTERIAMGFMSERDFPALTQVCGMVSASKLRMADVKSTDEFEEVVFSLAEEAEFSYVLCDWKLSREERLLAGNLVLTGNVTVCWPP